MAKAKRKKTESIHLRVTAEVKAKLTAIAERDSLSLTDALVRLIEKDSEGLPLNIQLQLV